MSSSRNTGIKALTDDIVKHGYLKKLKTMKKKYFVLRGDSADVPARLEYYDSEKKWKSNYVPKRCITLKTCFNINKRSDTRQKWVIALYTKNDCFCIVLESEEEMEEWLKALLELQRGEAIPEGEPVRPNFEHVWQVTVCNKELGNKNGILGLYRLCLTDQTLSLIRPGSDDKMNAIEFSLQKIRRCGHMDSFFYMEVGQFTVTGAGNLWMKAEDSNIAENMHTTILNACGNCMKDLQPKLRNRSSSANEASKPISLMQRWPTHTASSGSSGGGGSGGLGVNHQRTYSFPLSPIPPTRRASTGTRPTKYITSTSPQSSLCISVRERSDSMPSRARTTSEGAPHFPNSLRNFISTQFRPHSVYNRGISYSPPVASSPVSPASGACSTDSAGSSLSMDGDALDGQWDETTRYCHSLTPDEPVIFEENLDDYTPWPGEDEKLNNYVHTEPSYIQNARNCRKHSPNPNSGGFKSNSPSQGSYMEVGSPCGSSPMDTGMYLPTSPAENRGIIYGRPVNHSRGSSLAEEGYVPMVPVASDDGYVDMNQGPNKNKSDQYQSGDLSMGSSCSITSGTPSKDIRFSEYPLDKVISYFEEEPPSNDRPVRAYSVGSRPTNNKNRSEITNPSTCERTRAFSVGSKNVRPTNSSRMSMLNQQTLSSSHSSVEPSDDMMVLDFSKKARLRMRKKPSSTERLSVPGGSVSTLSSNASSYSTAEGSYLDMSPRASPSLAPSPPKSNRFSSFLGKSPPKHTLQEIICFNKSSPPVSGYPSPSLGRVPETEPGYVEMCVPTAYTSSPPGGYSASLNKNTKNKAKDDAYLEMKPGHVETKPVIAKNVKGRVDSFFVIEQDKRNSFFKPSASPSNTNLSGSNKDDYLDMSLKRKIPLVEDNNNSKVIVGNSPPKSQPDDYVEMNLNSQPTTPVADPSKDNPESNYMNMSGKKDRKVNKIDHNRFSSQPITIQLSSKDQSSNPVYSMAGRKHSTSTPPKAPTYLPIGTSPSPVSSPYSTLGRTRQKKTPGRRESKDSNSGLTTPTPTATIFPFSLTSPLNSPESYESSAKCPVDGTSGTIRLSYRDSHSENDLTAQNKEDSAGDYVNYDPRGLSAESEDYTLMEPASSSYGPCRKNSAPSFGAKMKPFEKLLSGLGKSFNTLSVTTVVTTNPPSPVNSESDTSTLVNDSLSIVEEDGNNKNGESSTSRKSSLTGIGDKELHYASLDLMCSGSESEDSNRTLKTQTSLTESSSASTPSPNLSTDTTAFNYAEIDFVKSGSSQKTIH